MHDKANRHIFATSCCELTKIFLGIVTETNTSTFHFPNHSNMSWEGEILQTLGSTLRTINQVTIKYIKAAYCTKATVLDIKFEIHHLLLLLE
jgi:hypothetical protein